MKPCTECREAPAVITGKCRRCHNAIKRAKHKQRNPPKDEIRTSMEWLADKPIEIQMLTKALRA